MTPKDKAIELFDRYYEFDFNTVWVNKQRKLAKQCALIAIDLLISETFLDFYVNHPQPFWQEVKTELEKL